MFAKPFSAWLEQRGIHYGFVIAFITFFTMLIMAAALGLPGAMMKPLNLEFGWSIDEVSSAVALRFLLYGLMGPFAALLMERYGLKKVMCCGLFFCRLRSCSCHPSICIVAVIRSLGSHVWELVQG
jgi:MFS family permease